MLEDVATATPTEVIGTPLDQADVVKVGVLAIRSAEAAAAQYQPLMSYVSDAVGVPFQLVPVNQETQFTEVEQGNLDFIFANPLAAVQIRRLYGTEFLATLSRINTGTQFGGLIIVRSDSAIHTVADTRGKVATCVAFQTAAGGCNFQVMHLLKNGVDAFTEFSSFTETPSQDNIVLGVLNGTFDVGLIRTGQLEKMVKDGTLLNTNEIRILDQADDDFYYPHTGQLYPEWPMAALPDTDPQLVAQVREALLALTADHPAMVNAGATGFVAGVDYAPIDELIERLQLRTWDAKTDN